MSGVPHKQQVLFWAYCIAYIWMSTFDLPWILFRYVVMLHIDVDICFIILFLERLVDSHTANGN